MGQRSGGSVYGNATAGERRKTPIKSLSGGHHHLRGFPYDKEGNFIVSKKTDWFTWDLGEVEPMVFLLQSPKGILSYAFSPDRNTIIIGNEDGTFRMFDMNRRDYQKQYIKAHKGGVVGVAYSPDGKTIVSASADKTIKLWDANTMRKKKVFSGDMGALTDMALRPDGKTIAAVDNTATILSVGYGDKREKKVAHSACGEGHKCSFQCGWETACGWRCRWCCHYFRCGDGRNTAAVHGAIRHK